MVAEAEPDCSRLGLVARGLLLRYAQRPACRRSTQHAEDDLAHHVWNRTAAEQFTGGDAEHAPARGAESVHRRVSLLGR